MHRFRSIALSILLIMLSVTVFSQDRHAAERIRMVETQIRNRGISDPATLSALEKVPRHLYVPEEYQKLAYRDRPLPIGYGQTISQPYIVAYMTEIINPSDMSTVLEIGTGSGYQAAILAELVKQVYTIEIVSELGQRAQKTLEANYANVSVKIADGYHGWEEKGPFDAIVVTAAAEYIPPPLIRQLKDGGSMIIPVGSPFMVQQLMLVRKEEGRVYTQSLMPVRFVPFTRRDE